MQDNRLGATLLNDRQVFFFYHVVTLEQHFVPVDRYHLTGIFVYKILGPGSEHAGRQLAAYYFFEISLGGLDLFRQAEQVEDILVGAKTDSAQQSGYREFLFTIDVSIHHIVYIGSKFDPGAFERDDPCRIQLGAVGVLTLGKEYPR